MKLFVKPVSTDLQYRAFFSEPQLGLGRFMDDKREQLIRQILTLFKLRLNDVKFNNAAPSNDFIHFSKFYGDCFLDVSFGLEEVQIVMRRSQSEALLNDVTEKIGDLLSGRPLSSQRFTVQEHFSSTGGSVEYLRSLNPSSPASFESLLSSVGVHYTLRVGDHNLVVYVTVVESLFVSGGIYLSIEFEFLPNKYALVEASKVTKEQYQFVLNGLELEIKELS